MITNAMIIGTPHVRTFLLIVFCFICEIEKNKQKSVVYNIMKSNDDILLYECII